MYTGTLLFLIIPIALTTIFIIKNKVSLIDNRFLLIIGIYTIWAFFSYIKYAGIHPSIYFIYLQLVIGFVIVKVFKMDMMYLYESIVTKLSLIGIVVWLTNMAVPQLWHTICPYFAFDNGDSISRYNFFFSSVLNLKSHPEMFFRNPGFSWEPGMNASVTIIAVFFNLARTNFIIKGNKNLIILMINLITSLSTTGYITFLATVVPFYILNKKISHSIMYLLLLIPFGMWLFQLDFMGQKIKDLQSDEDTMNRAAMMDTDRGVYTPQRFDGLAFELLNINADPLLGYGPSSVNSFVTTHVSYSLNLSNGCLKLYARYGLILGLILTLIMFFSSVKLGRYWECKYSWLLFVLYELISVSYVFYYLPFIIALFYSSIFLKDKEFDMCCLNSNKKYVI